MSKSLRNNPPKEVVDFMKPLAVLKYRELYDDITENGMKLSYQHRHALGELAITMVEVNYLRQCLLRDGDMIEMQGDRNIIKKRNPARETLEKIRPGLLRMLKEFKLTPSSSPTAHGPESQGENVDGFNDI